MKKNSSITKKEYDSKDLEQFITPFEDFIFDNGFTVVDACNLLSIVSAAVVALCVESIDYLDESDKVEKFMLEIFPKHYKECIKRIKGNSLPPTKIKSPKRGDYETFI